MLELPHVVVGSTIAYLIPNPLISLPLSLLSHFATDYVPHWNPHLDEEKKRTGHFTKKSVFVVATDSILALVVGTALSARLLPDSNQFLVSMLCCFLAVAPDVIEAPYFFLNWKNKWIAKLLKFQKNNQWNVPLPWGVLSQLVVMGVCFYFTLSA